ncbi:hypothetical protein K4L44_02535 [Halosquirtibacter laminarini]|uniref:Uncharacterized protein n=1 Tax=Halosquirtibacter laminarini TaxID=3374600 RepID=A0AC61NPV8_9BACT|nr:hypothetical protein K4L44_02535 [Prolixibacteraceae bacterium]
MTIAFASILFDYTFYRDITWESRFLTVFTPFVYAAICFTSGWFFGFRSRRDIPIWDLGLRSHAITFIVCNLTHELMLGTILGLPKSFLVIQHKTLLSWSIILTIHIILYFVFRGHSIKGLKRNEIFD